MLTHLNPSKGTWDTLGQEHLQQNINGNRKSQPGKKSQMQQDTNLQSPRNGRVAITQLLVWV